MNIDAVSAETKLCVVNSSIVILRSPTMNALNYHYGNCINGDYIHYDSMGTLGSHTAPHGSSPKRRSDLGRLAHFKSYHNQKTLIYNSYASALKSLATRKVKIKQSSQVASVSDGTISIITSWLCSGGRDHLTTYQYVSGRKWQGCFVMTTPRRP